MSQFPGINKIQIGPDANQSLGSLVATRNQEAQLKHDAIQQSANRRMQAQQAALQRQAQSAEAQKNRIADEDRFEKELLETQRQFDATRADRFKLQDIEDRNLRERNRIAAEIEIVNSQIQNASEQMQSEQTAKEAIRKAKLEAELRDLDSNLAAFMMARELRNNIGGQFPADENGDPTFSDSFVDSGALIKQVLGTQDRLTLNLAVMAQGAHEFIHGPEGKSVMRYMDLPVGAREAHQKKAMQMRAANSPRGALTYETLAEDAIPFGERVAEAMGPALGVATTEQQAALASFYEVVFQEGDSVDGLGAQGEAASAVMGGVMNQVRGIFGQGSVESPEMLDAAIQALEAAGVDPQLAAASLLVMEKVANGEDVTMSAILNQTAANALTPEGGGMKVSQVTKLKGEGEEDLGITRNRELASRLGKVRGRLRDRLPGVDGNVYSEAEVAAEAVEKALVLFMDDPTTLKRLADDDPENDGEVLDLLTKMGMKPKDQKEVFDYLKARAVTRVRAIKSKLLPDQQELFWSTNAPGASISEVERRQAELDQELASLNSDLLVDDPKQNTEGYKERSRLEEQRERLWRQLGNLPLGG